MSYPIVHHRISYMSYVGQVLSAVVKIGISIASLYTITDF